jgi:RimJ/RimL family protein N-acetyltransferase
MIFNLTKSKLRPWEPADAESLAYNANNYEIARNLRDVFPHPYSLKDAEFFINHMANTDPSQWTLAIEVEGSAVGGIGAHFLNDVYSRNVEVGYWLGQRYWGKGIVTEALSALVDFIFKNEDIIRIYADVFETNEGSIRVLEKCGFTKESIHAKAIFKNGIVLDEYVFVKLKTENK